MYDEAKVDRLLALFDQGERLSYDEARQLVFSDNPRVSREYRRNGNWRVCIDGRYIETVWQS